MFVSMACYHRHEKITKVYGYFLAGRTREQVDEIMDDIAEQGELLSEISDALTTGFGVNQDVDEVTLIQMVTVVGL